MLSTSLSVWVGNSEQIFWEFVKIFGRYHTLTPKVSGTASCVLDFVVVKLNLPVLFLQNFLVFFLARYFFASKMWYQFFSLELQTVKLCFFAFHPTYLALVLIFSLTFSVVVFLSLLHLAKSTNQIGKIPWRRKWQMATHSRILAWRIP